MRRTATIRTHKVFNPILQVEFQAGEVIVTEVAEDF
jgi:hypothetical protein